MARTAVTIRKMVGNPPKRITWDDDRTRTVKYMQCILCVQQCVCFGETGREVETGYMNIRQTWGITLHPVPSWQWKGLPRWEEDRVLYSRRKVLEVAYNMETLQAGSLVWAHTTRQVAAREWRRQDQVGRGTNSVMMPHESAFCIWFTRTYATGFYHWHPVSMHRSAVLFTLVKSEFDTNVHSLSPK